jgi:hypothetical protein
MKTVTELHNLLCDHFVKSVKFGPLFCFVNRSNLDKIDDIVVTLDTHNPDHIAHALFWNSAEDGSGVQPVPFQRITHDDVLSDKWFPLDPSLKAILF